MRPHLKIPPYFHFKGVAQLSRMTHQFVTGLKVDLDPEPKPKQGNHLALHDQHGAIGNTFNHPISSRPSRWVQMLSCTLAIPSRVLLCNLWIVTDTSSICQASSFQPWCPRKSTCYSLQGSRRRLRKSKAPHQRLTLGALETDLKQCLLCGSEIWRTIPNLRCIRNCKQKRQVMERSAPPALLAKKPESRNSLGAACCCSSGCCRAQMLKGELSTYLENEVKWIDLDESLTYSDNC